MLVTGGGRGIGAATARLAAERGYAVCINYLRDAATAEKLAKEIGGIAVAADVSLEADVMRLFETIDAKLRLHRMFGINVYGSFLCAREAIKRMSKRHGGAGGAIVNVSSIAAKLGGSGEYVDYAAAKGAIDTFTIGLAKELGPDGIRVNAVRPGVINTEIHAMSGDPARLARIGATAPLGRYGEPEEVARTILWLLSDEASYTTGALLDVSGGR
jgi:NAD(P)-dependent dehydrogenase (short-subunit alcohol dehydrogenase family)